MMLLKQSLSWSLAISGGARCILGSKRWADRCAPCCTTCYLPIPCQLAHVLALAWLFSSHVSSTGFPWRQAIRRGIQEQELFPPVYLPNLQVQIHMGGAGLASGAAWLEPTEDSKDRDIGNGKDWLVVVGKAPCGQKLTLYVTVKKTVFQMNEDQRYLGRYRLQKSAAELLQINQ